MVQDVVVFVLSNIQIPLLILALITTIAKLRGASARHEVMTASYTLWGEVLFYCVGVAFVYFWYLHAYLPSFTAPLIGWQPSPFEWELAWAELGIACIALLALWRGYEMRLAATLTFALFSFGAAAQHIHEMMVARNYAPGNAGLVLWFGDIALPIVILALALAARDADERIMGRSRV
jgi:hypothetical protein